jgi:NADP-dependent 3-hydroxy acid dehydrogenase YdfG
MFWGVVYPTMALLPQFCERRDGRIVNITSIGGNPWGSPMDYGRIWQ